MSAVPADTDGGVEFTDRNSNSTSRPIGPLTSTDHAEHRGRFGLVRGTLGRVAIERVLGVEHPQPRVRDRGEDSVRSGEELVVLHHLQLVGPADCAHSFSATDEEVRHLVTHEEASDLTPVRVQSGSTTVGIDEPGVVVGGEVRQVDDLAPEDVDLRMLAIVANDAATAVCR